MLEKIMRIVPVPTLVGFILSIVAAIIAWILACDTTVVFAILFVLLWVLGLISEYRAGLLENFIGLSLLLWLGYLPVLLLSFLF